MTFGAAISSGFKNLTNFSGRARRSEFWWFYLFMVLVGIPVQIVIAVPMFAAINDFTNSLDPNSDTITQDQLNSLFAGLGVPYAIAILFGLLVFFLLLAVWVRRLHDGGYSGHWLWLSLIGLSIVPFILAILDGQHYANKWGPDPKAIQHEVWPHRQAGPAWGDLAATPTPPPYYPPVAPPAAPPVAPVAQPAPLPPVDPAADPFAAPPR